MKTIILAGETPLYSNGANLRLNSIVKFFENQNFQVEIKYFESRGQIFPFQYLYLLNTNMRMIIRNSISDYDLVVIATINLAILQLIIGPKAKIIDICDSLQSILKFRFRNESPYRFIKSLFSNFFLFFFIRKFDTLTYVTVEDLEQDGKLFSNTKSSVIPNAKNFSLMELSPISGKDKPLVVGFIADLEYKLNLIQYEFIIEELLPSLTDSGFVLQIYGNRPEKLKIPYPVIHRGYLSNIADIYREIDVSLCPDFDGFGFKNKVQESLLASRPVITTPLGARGQTSSVGLIINSTSEEMKSTLKKLSNRNFLQNLSYQMKMCSSQSSESLQFSDWVVDIFKKNKEE